MHKAAIGAMMVTILAATACARGGGNENSSATSADALQEQQVARNIERLRREIEAASQRRSTPDQAIHAYFEAAALYDELTCYRDAATRADPLLSKTEMREIGDRFFHGVGIEHRHSFRRDLQECLGRRERVSVELLDVEMNTPTHATIMIRLKNVTPVPEGAVVDDYARERRRDGEEYRVQLTKAEDGWKIEQVYTKSFGDDWRPSYTSDVYVPSIALFPMTP